MARFAHFHLAGGHHFDGSSRAVVTIEYHGAQMAFFRVRPFRRRRVFELALADVARGVIFDVVRRELAERKATRRKGGRRG